MFNSITVELEQLAQTAPALRDLSIYIKLEILNEFRDEVISNIRRLDHSKYFKKSSGALFNSIGGLIVEDRIIFYSTKQYFKAVEEGVKPYTMWHLLGKTIPLKKEGGAKPIFRKCTLKSILNGGWRHPGSEGKHFLKDTIDRVTEKLPAIIARRIFQHTGVLLA